MRACTMANGAVFFIPENIERKSKVVSFAELVDVDAVSVSGKSPKMGLFGRFLRKDKAKAPQTRAA